jgi:hypothetical protein
MANFAHADPVIGVPHIQRLLKTVLHYRFAY